MQLTFKDLEKGEGFVLLEEVEGSIEGSEKLIRVLIKITVRDWYGINDSYGFRKKDAQKRNSAIKISGDAPVLRVEW